MSRFTLLDRLRGSVLAGSVGTSASEDKLLSSRESHPGVIPDDPGLKLGSCLAERVLAKRNKYSKRARISEAKIHEVVRYVAADLTANHL